MSKYTRAEVEAIVVHVVAYFLEIPEADVTDEMDLSVDPSNPMCKDREYTEIDLAEIIMDLEDEFQLDINGKAAEEADTVGKLKALCVKLTGAEG